MRVLVIVAFSCMCLVGCDDGQAVPIDEGLRRVLVPGAGPDDQPLEVELRPGLELPHVINWDGSVGDSTLFPEAIELVNGWLEAEAYVEVYDGCPPVTVVGSVGCVLYPMDYEYVSRLDGWEGTAGLTRLWFDHTSGEVREGAVLLSEEVAVDHEAAVVVAARGLLLALGLADDPGVSEAPQLGSIMSEPFDTDGVLTEHDRALLTPYLQ